MDILEWLLSLFISPEKQDPRSVENHPGIFPGVLIDERPAEARLGDIRIEELVSAFDIVDWKQKTDKELRSFGVQDQATQSSCVANAGRKALRIQFMVNNNLDVDFSSADIYRRRVNYPDPGMLASDLWVICGKGVTLNSLVPSDNLTEAEVNSLKVPLWKRQVGDVFKIGVGVDLPTGDIDAVASVIQRTKKGVVLFYYFTAAEYSKEFPTVERSIGLRDATTLRHAVTAVDYTIRNGVKCLVVEDSAHFGGHARRFITEDFHNKRCFYAGYSMNFTFNPEEVSVNPSFDKDMMYGEQSDNVKTLQLVLRSLSLFPSNVEATGYYGAVTARAVLDFQRKYAVADSDVIESLKGRRVGPSTREALNKLIARSN